MKRIKLKESDLQRLVKRVLKEDDKEQEVEDIVHRKMDEFATDTMSEFIDIVGEIEDELQEENINDDGFLYKTQLIFFEELVDLVDHCIEEIKHGIHHHHEMEHLQHHKKDGNDTQLHEQKQYSDDDYDYSFYKGVNASKIEREIKDIISEKLKIRKTDLYNRNPHLEEDIKRLAQRIMSDVYSNVISYLNENYEGEIEDIINGDFE